MNVTSLDAASDLGGLPAQRDRPRNSLTIYKLPMNLYCSGSIDSRAKYFGAPRILLEPKFIGP
jgi:hypothetical protein